MFRHPLKRWMTAVAVPLALSTVILLVKGFDYAINYVDALGVGGAMTLGIGLLSLMAFFGAFDTFGYSISSFRASNRKYKDLYEYSNIKAEKRSKAEWTFFPFILTGLIFILAGAAVSIICL